MTPKADIHTLRASAYRFLGRRNRSVGEVRQKLLSNEKRWQLPTGSANQVIAELQEQRLLDDTQFSQEWLQSKRTNRGYGPLRIQQQLQQKGVDRQSTYAALATISSEEWTKTAVALVQKLREKWSVLPPLEFRIKTQNYLLRRGFSLEIIRRAIDHSLEIK